MNGVPVKNLMAFQEALSRRAELARIARDNPSPPSWLRNIGKTEQVIPPTSTKPKSLTGPVVDQVAIEGQVKTMTPEELQPYQDAMETSLRRFLGISG